MSIIFDFLYYKEMKLLGYSEKYDSITQCQQGCSSTSKFTALVSFNSNNFFIHDAPLSIEWNVLT